MPFGFCILLGGMSPPEQGFFTFEIHRLNTGSELARGLATTALSPEEARASADDLRQARVSLSPPEDKWR